MQLVNLGMTDLKVSRIAFGAWEFGGEWGSFDEDAAIGFTSGSSGPPKAQYKFWGSFFFRALGGVDTALWDLMGKATGRPVYDLAQLKAQLTDAFQNKANVDYLKANGYCSQDCAFGGGGSWGYAPVDDAFYNPIRQVCAITENKNCTTE